MGRTLCEMFFVDYLWDSMLEFLYQNNNQRRCHDTRIKPTTKVHVP
jgi:hypothetical protein